MNKNLRVFLPWLKLDVLFFLQNNKNLFQMTLGGFSPLLLPPLPAAKPNPVKPRPDPSCEAGAALNSVPLLPHFL